MHKILATILLLLLLAAGIYVAWPAKRIHVVPVYQTSEGEWKACGLDACPTSQTVE